MKIDLDEALKEIKDLFKLAEDRMIDGTEKYGTEMVEDPLKELKEELADLIDYAALTLIEIKRLKNELGRKGSSNNRDNKRNW